MVGGMGLRVSVLWKAVAATLSGGFALMLQTKPNDVLENVQAWFALIGVEQPPTWMQTSTFAAYARPGSLALLVGSLTWLLWPLFVRAVHLAGFSLSQKRAFIPEGMSCADLSKPFSDFTNLEAESMVSRYIGKWMKVRGTVRNISDTKAGAIQVDCDTQNFKRDNPLYVTGTQTFLHFSGKNREGAKLLSKGTTVSAVGRIRRIGHTSVTLYYCEIVGSGRTTDEGSTLPLQ